MSDTLEAFGHDEKVSKNILIVGGGNIGFNLAKTSNFGCSKSKNYWKKQRKSWIFASELNNTIVINGDALDEEVLTEANLQEAETVLH